MNRLAVARVLDTPDGPFGIVADDRFVLASGWSDDLAWLCERVHVSVRPGTLDFGGDGGVMAQAVAAVRDYYEFRGDAIMRVPVDQPAGPFVGLARRVMREIPAGRTWAYTELAARAGNPRAARAAASACALNNNALFVPCHRVVRNDGTLGGFYYGLELKQALLDRERATSIGS
jgi:methylated-DNA-[protein]-cysteine S-methyltransferase